MESTITKRVVLERSEMSERCGCMAKLDGVTLGRVVSGAFASASNPRGETVSRPEDCAVLPAMAGQVLSSVDFGPLVGPDLYRSGRIAAVHGLSDIYAMGGRPRAALAMLVVDPSQPERAATDVLEGILASCAADEVEVLGGHTIVGQEALAGVSVVGEVGERLLYKQGAKAGERLLLSKPVGAGLALRAYRHGLLELADLEPALRSMEASNRVASRCAIEAEVRAATDVTGYGLLGHLAEMLATEGLGAKVSLGNVPILEAAVSLPKLFARSRWMEANLEYCRGLTRLSGVLDRELISPLLDPQTSGGLLLAAPAERVEQLCRVGFHAIGVVTKQSGLEVTR